MRTSPTASLFAALTLLLLAGCSQEAPRLSAPSALAAKAPPAPTAPPPPPVVKASAAAPVREKLGAGQCRTCHRLQYDSWVKSGHARKALDCEGCHGNGSDYANAAVMKDPAKSRAAGLIFQTAAFCEKCHPTADDAFLPKAHAHERKHVSAPAAP